jgi:hypothetical protein
MKQVAQRLALVAGGWAETGRQNGKNSKQRERLENAARTHLSTARIVRQICAARDPNRLIDIVLQRRDQSVHIAVEIWI